LTRPSKRFEGLTNTQEVCVTVCIARSSRRDPQWFPGREIISLDLRAPPRKSIKRLKIHLQMVGRLDDHFISHLSAFADELTQMERERQLLTRERWFIHGDFPSARNHPALYRACLSVQRIVDDCKKAAGEK